jgi:arylsulfatase A-like enzyme
LFYCFLFQFGPRQIKRTEKVQNVFLIMSDELKASALAVYGNTVCKTSNVDQLAKSGMVIERAYCQGLAYSPSRPSMMPSKPFFLGVGFVRPHI